MALDPITQNVLYEHESALRLSVMTSGAKHSPLLVDVPKQTYDMEALQRLYCKAYGLLPLYSSFYKQHKKLDLSSRPELIIYKHPALAIGNDEVSYIGRITTLRLDHFLSYCVVLAELERPGTIHPYLFALAQMFTQTHTDYESGVLAPIIGREKPATLAAVAEQVERLTRLLKNMAGRRLLSTYYVTGSYVLLCRDELNLDELKKHLGELHFQLGRAGGMMGGGKAFNDLFLFGEDGTMLSRHRYVRADAAATSERVRIHHLKRKLAALTA